MTIAHQTLLDRVVPIAAAHTQRWREGFLRIVSAYNMTAGRELSIAYGLPHEVVPNNSQAQRIAWGEQYLMEDTEKFEGYLAGFLVCAPTREDYLQIVGNQVERCQASDQLRRAMYQFLQNGKLD